jgi:hypothetical protein
MRLPMTEAQIEAEEVRLWQAEKDAGVVTGSPRKVRLLLPGQKRLRELDYGRR